MEAISVSRKPRKAIAKEMIVKARHVQPAARSPSKSAREVTIADGAWVARRRCWDLRVVAVAIAEHTAKPKEVAN